MNKVNDCTVLIPSHNRHDYLMRCIRYLSGSSYPVVICDSSSNPFCEQLPENIRYVHMPGMNFAEKIIATLPTIDTKYIMLCADDDLLLEEGLTQALGVIRAKSDILCMTGNHLAFDDDAPDSFYVFNKIYPPIIASGNTRKNIKNFFTNYQQILWSLYERDHLLKCFRIIQQARISNDNFIEFILGVATLCAGKIGSIKEFMVAREITEQDHWGRRHPSLVGIKDNVSIQKDFESVCQALDAVFPDGRANARLALDSYISGVKRNTPGIKAAIKRVLRRLPAFGKKTAIGKRLVLTASKKQYINSQALKAISDRIKPDAG